MPVTTSAASTGDEPGTTGDGPGTTGDGPGTTGDETGTTGETDTDDEPLLPGCGDTPPADFHAEPSAPADGAAVPGPSVDLEVTIGGTILADATAKFHLREVHTLTDADDFTIVILPDTQNYTQFPGNFLNTRPRPNGCGTTATPTTSSRCCTTATSSSTATSRRSSGSAPRRR
ncbi:hypothetical protein [Nannocystis pusilla]|uniref:hypothetical protein n=1 Tax=Nannocystis pusilla TaxID=889268 RepID=UPI003B80C00D